MPSTAPFRVLEREKTFKQPSDKGFSVPHLQSVVKPHITSFNALTELRDQNDAPTGHHGGLLALMMKDLGKKKVFDAKLTQQDDSASPLGNQITCAYMILCLV